MNDETVPLLHSIYQENGQSNTDTSVNSGHCHGRNHLDGRHEPDAATRKARRKLVIASVLCLLFMIAELIGGLLANSLALLTDAAHMLSDFAGFLISLFAIWVAQRPATKKMSFGFYRAEVVGALTSVLIIWILTGVLVYQAVERLRNGEKKIDAKIMLITAALGVCMNIFLGLVLHQHGGHGHTHGGRDHAHDGHGHAHDGHGHSSGDSHSTTDNGDGRPNGRYGGLPPSGDTDVEDVVVTTCHLGSVLPSSCENNYEAQRARREAEAKNINVRAAFIHVIGDMVQSVGVLIAAFIIYFYPKLTYIDPVCTFLFSVLVLLTTLRIFRDGIHVLMEGSPKGIEYEEVKRDLESIRGVKMAHSLHMWCLTMGRGALAVHLVIDPESSRTQQDILQDAQRLVREKYNMQHTTIQIEVYHVDMDSCSECQDPID